MFTMTDLKWVLVHLLSWNYLKCLCPHCIYCPMNHGHSTHLLGSLISMDSTSKAPVVWAICLKLPAQSSTTDTTGSEVSNRAKLRPSLEDSTRKQRCFLSPLSYLFSLKTSSLPIPQMWGHSSCSCKIGGILSYQPISPISLCCLHFCQALHFLFGCCCCCFETGLIV